MLEGKAKALSEQVPKLASRSKQLKEAYEQVLDYSSNQDFKCGLKDLNDYIKLEKALCQKVASCLESEVPTDSKPGLNIGYLHKLLQKKRFEDALRELNIAKLEA